MQIYEYVNLKKEKYKELILSDEGITPEKYIEKIKIDIIYTGDL